MSQAQHAGDPAHAPVRTPVHTTSPSEPSREAVAKRAFELYLQRGSLSGYEVEDWLQAEAELIAESASTAEAIER